MHTFGPKSQSLAVTSVYHSAYDEIRDTIERTTGMVPITEVWTNLLIMTIGIIQLLKADWEGLLPDKADSGDAKPTGCRYD